MAKFLTIKQTEPLVEEGDDGCIHFIGPGAIYFKKHPQHRVWVTLVHEYERWTDDDGYDCFDEWFAFDCSGPHPKHWLAYEIDGVGLDEIVTNNSYTSGCRSPSPMQFLLRNGIAPGQNFVMEIDYHVSQDYWTGEVDAETEARVMSVETWSPEDILDAWTNYLSDRGSSQTEEELGFRVWLIS